ncbi:MAG TPA: CHAD domain-containing protein [Bryobacteraceae bacterium]|nr:CHAD domain-containing protein [Bryobacteraceae bacterium]
MAYHLKSGHHVPDELKRIAREELESAAANLRGEGGIDRSKAIHETRKSIKKVRAVLRLMRDELGATFGRENTRLRNLGLMLSGTRDAAVMIQTFDTVLDKFRPELGRRKLPSIRRVLVARKQEAEKRSSAVVERAAGSLRAAASRVKSWPLEEDGFEALAPGLERNFRRGRAALATAQKNPKAENFHELRKRVKCHWYHVRLLELLWTDVMTAYESSLKELETWLGDDHNLAVLLEKISSRFPAKKSEIDLLSGLIQRYQDELRKNAVSLAERVYAEKPNRFGTRMEHLWEAWESQPKSFKEHEKERRKGPASAPKAQKAVSRKSAA